MYLYEHYDCFFAQFAPGMEELAREELLQLGAQEVKHGYLGLYFQADKRALYRINYCSKFLIRILAPLKAFDCHSPDQLYQRAKGIEWKDFLDVDHTFAIFTTVANSSITHSQYAGFRVKDAIVDYFKAHCGKRPDVDPDYPDVWFNLHIENNRATIHLDTSGGSLHRRGYRIATVAAPMQETLAAAIIQLSGWDGSKPLYDPMCGSGTLLSEALMRYCHIPSGFLRNHFGFENLPDFDPDIWKNIRAEGQKPIRALPPHLIQGSDISAQAIAIAQANQKKLPSGDAITLQTMDFANIPSLKDYTIVCNPPYGIRMGEQAEMADFYKRFGDFLKNKCQGSTAFIYFGDRQWLKCIGLRTGWKKALSNGGLDGRLAKFELY